MSAVTPDEAAAIADPFLRYPDGLINGMFDCKPQPQVWLAHERLLMARAHVLPGAGGTSKTTTLYHLGLGAVLGSLPWNWKIDTTGSAALFLVEDSLDEVHRTLHLMGAKLSEPERKRLTKMLRVFPLAGKRSILLELDGNRLFETAFYGWLMDRIDKMPKPVAFIGFDPALGLTEGDEMSPAHQRRLGEVVDRVAIETGACVVLTAHAAKSIHQADELGSHSSRGSGALTDAVRGEFTLRNMTADEAKRFGIADIVDRKRYVQLAATKGNRLPPEAYAPVWLYRGDGGLLSEVTLEQVERGSVGPRELKALQILKDACCIDSVPSETAVKFWRDQCIAAKVIPPGTDAAQEKAMTRIRTALVAADLVIPGKVRGLWVPA